MSGDAGFGSPVWHPGDDQCCDLIMGLLSRADSEALLSHFEECVACEERFRRLATDWETAGSLALRARPDDDKVD